MADNLKKKPKKSILKNSSSFDHEQHTSLQKTDSRKSAKWDEMNIIATLHPPDKDYGHMKIDEPKTPYNYDNAEPSQSEVNPDELASKLRESKPAKVLEDPEAEDDDEDEDEELTAEEKALRKDFEMKRKAHYNEYYAVKLARKLLEEEEEDEEENDQHAGSSNKHKK